MKKQHAGGAVAAAALLVGALIGFGYGQWVGQDHGRARASSPPAAGPKKKVQRFGHVIGLKKEKAEYYNKLHANPWPGVNAMIKKCNIRNYSIYETELDGKLYLFAYFEYTGDDFKADMAMMAKDPETVRWWKETDPCQIRLAGTPEGEQWLRIPAVYHLD